MMQQEFEQLAGYEVSYDDYVNIIEPMYMATDLSKEDFVQCISKKRFALPTLKSIIKNMQQCAASLKETCTHYTDWDTKEELNRLIEEYIPRRFGAYSRLIHYSINDRSYQSCYYPDSVEFYDSKTYETVETIKLL